MRKYIILIVKITLIVSLPIFLLFTSVEIATFDLNFFEKKYEQYNIVEETGIAKEELMKVTEELLSYLNGERKDIVIYTKVHGELEQVFEEREILHLKDVRELYKKGFIIRNISFLLVLFSLIFLFRYGKEKIPGTLLYSSNIPLLLIVIFSIMLMSDFNKYFTYFHLILFDNDLWLLNPDTDILIQMYPLDFFYSIAFKIMALFIFQLIIVMVIGLILYIKKKKY